MTISFIFRLVILSILVLVAALVVLSYTPGVWLSETGQFRLLFIVILSICLVVLICFREIKSIIACVFVLTAASLPVVGQFPPAKCSAPDAKQELRILNYNTEFQHNDNVAAFIGLIHAQDPDVITIVEVDQKWIDLLSDAMLPYKYRKIVIKGAGIAVYSKFPMNQIEVQLFGRSHHPRIKTKLVVGDKQVTVMAIHPTTPKYSTTFAERNAELQLVADELSQVEGPRILIGDFNCGPWSAAFERLLKVGLVDSEQGFGPQPSWPARTGRIIDHVPIPPFVPIDHVLMSKDFCVVERRAGPAIGSDHLPVFVRAKF